MTGKIPSIAVIGRGFAGIKMIWELIDKAEPGKSFEILSYDSKPLEEIGSPAYVNEHPDGPEILKELTLNVPADKMGAHASDKGMGFLNFLKKHEGDLRKKYPQFAEFKFEAGQYVPRALYKEYLYNTECLDALWQEAEEKAKVKGITLTPLVEEVQGIKETIVNGNARLRVMSGDLATGNQHARECNRTVLAIGNAPPPRIPANDLGDKDERVAQDPLSSRNPLNTETLRRILKKDADGKYEKVTIVLRGFGLTGVDQALVATKLMEKIGIDYEIIAMRRRDDRILAHPEKSKTYPANAFMSDLKKNPALFDKEGRITADTLIAAFRREIAKVKDLATNNGDHTPQDVADTFRTEVPKFWRTVDLEERNKFLREYLSEYRYYRNRVTPEANAKLGFLEQNGKLKYVTGTLEGVESRGMNNPLTLRYTPKGSDEVAEITSNNLLVLNCSGQNPSLKDRRRGLAGQLVDAGLAVEAGYGGFLTDQNGNAINITGNDSRVTVIGNNLHSTLEEIGVRELRAAVEERADYAIKAVNADRDLENAQYVSRRGELLHKGGRIMPDGSVKVGGRLDGGIGF